MLKLLRSLLFLVFIQVSLTASSQIIIQPVGPSAICSGNAVLLKVSGGDSGVHYKWYKDGTFLPAETAAELTVSSPGSYHVEVIKDETVQESAPVEVKESIPPNTDFTFTNDNQCAGTEIKFTAADHKPGNKYLWDFGDGKTSTEVSPAHRYDAIGGGIKTFNAKLTITNADGCANTSNVKSLKVKERPDARLGGSGSTSINGKAFFIQKASNPYSFTFTNISQTESTNTNYKINWGDNSPDFVSSSFATANHIYQVGPHQWSFNLLYFFC